MDWGSGSGNALDESGSKVRSIRFITVSAARHLPWGG